MNGAGERWPPTWQVAAVLITTFLFYIGMALFFGGTTNKAFVVLLELLLILPAALFAWSEHYPAVSLFRLRPIRPVLLAIGILLGLGIGAVRDELDHLVQGLVPMPARILESLQAFMVIRSIGDAALLGFGMVVVAGVVEEMLLRGFLQGTLEQGGRPAKAVVVSALVFSFLHLNPWWAFQIFLMGICLGVLTWRCGSIWPAVVIHATNNAVSLVFINTDASKLKWYLSGDHVSPAVLAGVVAATVLGFHLFFRHAPHRRSPIDQTGGT